MFKRYLHHTPLLDDPSDGGGGGSTENGAGSSGVAEAAGGGITSGTASEALIAAATASESSTEKPATTTGTGDELVDLTAEARATAAATQQPKAGDTTVKGPVPADRHIAAVRNARQEGATEARAEYSGLTPAQVKQMATLVVPLLQNREGFLTRLATDLGYTLTKGGAAKVEEKVAEPFKFPTGKLRAEDGSMAYSTDQMQEILQGMAERLKTELKGEMKPLFDFKDAGAQRELDENLRVQAQADGREILTEMRARPYFQTKDASGKVVDHPKILEYLRAIDPAIRAKNPKAAVFAAYQTFMEKDVLPAISNRARTDVNNDNRRKAAANVSVHPGGGAAPAAKKDVRDGDVSGLAKRMEEMANAGAV